MFHRLRNLATDTDRSSLCSKNGLVLPFGTGRWHSPTIGFYPNVWWQYQCCEEQLKSSDHETLSIRNWNTVLLVKRYTECSSSNNSKACPIVGCQSRTQHLLNGEWMRLSNDEVLKWSESLHLEIPSFMCFEMFASVWLPSWSIIWKVGLWEAGFEFVVFLSQLPRSCVTSVLHHIWPPWDRPNFTNPVSSFMLLCI